MLNNNEPLSSEYYLIFDSLQYTNDIVIINKTDLETRINMDEVNELAKNKPVITTSIIQDEGIDALEKALYDLFFSGEILTDTATFVSNVRHIQLLTDAKKALEDAMEALELNIPLDMVQIDVTRTWEFLGEIIGDTASESLIDQLFSQFCLGK